jgi:Tfp pilus assembly protein FimT
MKIRNDISRAGNEAGITLVECIVYIAVLLVLSAGAMGAFYLSWDHSKALISAADDITAALQAGERWRADVRAASGTIDVEKTPSGEVVTIPANGKDIVYRFNAGELRRQAGSGGFSAVLLPRVVSSEMALENRGNVRAWRWELEVAQRRKETHLPLLFTFEAAQKTQ